jgi:hypothetical protein
MATLIEAYTRKMWNENEANPDDIRLFALKKLQNRSLCGKALPSALDVTVSFGSHVSQSENHRLLYPSVSNGYTLRTDATS